MQDAIVNPMCARKIATINSTNPEELKFNDFAGLKTYGRDKVSEMKMGDLKDLVSESEMKQIKDAFCDDKSTIKVLRWMKRGLSLNHAVYKVQVDQEISLSALGNHFGKEY